MPSVQNFSGPWPGAPAVDPPGGGGEDAGVQAHLRALETDAAVIKATMSTKDDLAALGKELRGEMSTLRAGAQGDMASLRESLKADMASLRASLMAGMASLRVELHRELNQQTWKLFGVCALLIGATFVVARNVMPPADLMAAAQASAAAAPVHATGHP